MTIDPRTNVLTGMLVLVAVVACEGDAKKLERLRAEADTACLPVLVADSANEAYASLDARIAASDERMRRWKEDPSTATVAAVKADIAEEQRDSAMLVARLSQSPAQKRARANEVEAQRTKCDLAKRSINIFMSGR